MKSYCTVHTADAKIEPMMSNVLFRPLLIAAIQNNNTVIFAFFFLRKHRSYDLFY